VIDDGVAASKKECYLLTKLSVALLLSLYRDLADSIESGMYYLANVVR